MSGPTASPTLPPVPCRDMAKPRFDVNCRESEPMAAGCHSEMATIMSDEKTVTSQNDVVMPTRKYVTPMPAIEMPRTIARRFVNRSAMYPAGEVDQPAREKPRC